MSNNNQTPGTSSPTLPRGLVSRRGGLVNPSERMTSLRPPRDLTLGGKPKKSFKPNIPVRKDRTRDEPTESTSASSSSTSREHEKRSHKDGNNRGGPGGRGRGRGRGGRRQLETIQTHSIFEQGPMERSKGRGSSALLMFIDDPNLPKADERYNPVHLPLTASLPKREKIEKKRKAWRTRIRWRSMPYHATIICSLITLNHSFIIDMVPPGSLPGLSNSRKFMFKSEPPDKDVEMKEFAKPALVSDKLKSTSKVSSMKEEVTCASLFGSDRFDSEGELVFFQLPDTLPSFPSSKEDEERKPVIKQEKDAQHQQQKEDQDTSSEGMCCLKDLPEGYLGKLQVMKSGKTRLVLGNVKLDVSMGSPCGFLQDLVSVKLGGDKGGELITLGHVNHRVVCTPDFEQLLQLGS
ncbi:DNA-directed RNA polymerase III subunit RPC4-like [Amphiura filiformis]|uniref:DNA-directed RNA polymerase III subunit RPC4-like n=1 Tax=Amphiura filiformis TaxID=82378 RepID=UPI003B20DFFA